MPNLDGLQEIKERIRSSIAWNSDRGFVPYSGCNRVCSEFASILKMADDKLQSEDYQRAFDIYIIVFLETVKLASHADDSGGGCSDIVHYCIEQIDEVCRRVSGLDTKHYLDTILKTVKNKAFKGWEEWAYRLLKSVVYFIDDDKQAKKIYDLFPVLGQMYDGDDYPEKLLITRSIIERVEGKEAADRYLMKNIHIPELRMIAIENAMAEKNFALVEKLCQEAIKREIHGPFYQRKPWAYYLEQIYSETGNSEELLTVLRYILFSGDTAYFQKLKTYYISHGTWEIEQEKLWPELPGKIGIQYYVDLLFQENELKRLLEVVKSFESYIEYYGKQLAAEYPDEVHRIFEEYILKEAKQATDRGKYKRVCHLLKNFAEANGKEQALILAERLIEMYPRRPAMLDELERLKKKLNK